MNRTSSRTRWYVVTLIFLTYVLMFIDRVNISIAARPIMVEYRLSGIQMGWVFSAFVLGYAALQVPGGWLSDRFGPERVLGGSIILWSAFTAMTAAAGTLPLTTLIGVAGSFGIVRCIVGFGEAAAPPSATRVIANWLPPEERGRALGVAISGITAGGAVAPPVIVWIVDRWGWRAAFYLAAAVGLVLAACWKQRAGRLPPGLRSSATISQLPWRSILGRRDLWCVTLAYFAFGYVLYIYFTWFYLYLISTRGIDPQVAGYYTVMPFALSTVSAPIGGWLTDSLSRRFGGRVGRCVLGMSGLTMSGLLIVLGASSRTNALAVSLFSLAAGALYLSVSSYWAATIDLCRDYAGTASGFMNTGANLGGALSPSLTPLIARDYGWNDALYFAAGIAVLGALFWLGVRPERPLCASQDELVAPCAKESSL